MCTVQATCSPIRLLTPQGLDLERALPGGCMTAPLPASSAIACNARTDCVVYAREHSKPKAGDVLIRRGAWLRWAVSWRGFHAAEDCAIPSISIATISFEVFPLRSHATEYSL